MLGDMGADVIKIEALDGDGEPEPPAQHSHEKNLMSNLKRKVKHVNTGPNISTWAIKEAGLTLVNNEGG